MTKATTGLVHDNDLAFLKLDTWAATCDAPGHEHLPGNFAKEASIDAYLDYLAAIRKTQPRIFLDATCGVWLSPWFLKEADALWGEVWDGIPPSSSVPALNDIEGACTSRDKLFRNRCEETPSFPPEAMKHLGMFTCLAPTPTASCPPWAAAAVSSPSVRRCPPFQRRELAVRGQALKWAKANQSTLTGDIRIILGDPLARALRLLPFRWRSRHRLSAQPVHRAAQRHVPTGSRQQCCPHRLSPARTLPRGEVVQLRLDGYETVILQFDPAPKNLCWRASRQAKRSVPAGDSCTESSRLPAQRRRQRS